jgi:hypothetical protein
MLEEITEITKMETEAIDKNIERKDKTLEIEMMNFT